MYAAVYHFGPRWPENGSSFTAPKRFADGQFEDLKLYIIKRESPAGISSKAYHRHNPPEAEVRESPLSLEGIEDIELRDLKQ